MRPPPWVRQIWYHAPICRSWEPINLLLADFIEQSNALPLWEASASSYLRAIRVNSQYNSDLVSF